MSRQFFRIPSGGGERALLDTRVDEVALLRQRRDKQIPQVQLAYPRNGVWSGNNQLGVELPFQPDTNNVQTIFKLDEWGFPETWTISLAQRLDRDLVAGEVFDAVGLIDFGAGGIQQSFEVDWVEGTIFSLPMNAINIRARWNEVALIAGILPPDGMRISVQISKGATRHARATRTLFFNVIAGTSSDIRRIPDFSKSVILTPINAASAAALYAATTSIEMLANNTAVNPSLVALGSQLGPTSAFRIPVPALSHYFRITNAGAVDLQCATIWNLFDE
jgi:hypothetical protein